MADMEKLTKRVCGNTVLSKKGKTMRKTIQTYLSGFEIERFSPVSMALWAAAMAFSLYTPHEENLIYLYEALLHIKAVLVCLLLVLLLIKILLLRKLDTLFDIVTLIILMSFLYSTMS